MNVALFASGPVGCRIASALAEHGVRPVCVVLDAADADRHCELLQALGDVEGIPVLSSDEVRQPGTVERLRGMDIDIGVLAWWPHIIRPELIAAARLGFLNLHPSLLPHDRGKDPNFWALVEEAPFGVTLHFVDDGVDTGPVAFQRQLDVRWEDTGASLYQRAVDAIVDLFRDSLPRILTGDIPRVPQDGRAATAHRRAALEPASRIELDEPTTARRVLNLLRARTFPPHPAAWFESEGERYEVRVEIRRTADNPPASSS